uniref:Glycoprotein n=1 Tax=Shuangao Bedbug Virus 1 TaxID=1608071 RepID=A0A0B5KY04_9RHAB|nr:glycoprotein precursor [Shuangao Bedbug Virus 1]
MLLIKYALLFLFSTSLAKVQVFRGRLFKGVENAMIISDEKGGKCCGTMVQNQVSLNISNCDNGVICDGEMIVEYSENRCKSGYPYGTICGEIKPEGKGPLCSHRTECKCHSGKYYCDSASGTLPSNISCNNKYHYALNKNGHLVKNVDGKFVIGFIRLPVCVIDSHVLMKSHHVKDNMLVVELQSNDQSSCEINIGNNKCTAVCDKECSIRCKLPQHVLSHKSAKIKASVRCDDWQEKIWLFRDSQHNIHSALHSHTRWTNLRADIAEVLYFDILFGYFIITFLIYATYFTITNSAIIVKYFKKIYGSCWKYDMADSQGNCTYCDMHLLSLEDAYLHSEFCSCQTCPYCGISVEYSVQHITVCKKRDQALHRVAEEINIAEKDEGQILRRNFKKGVLERIFKYNHFTYKLWLFTIFALTISVLIVPSQGKLEQPCSKTLGETANCQSDMFRAVKGSPNDHHHWTAVELGLYDKIEQKLQGSAYQMNKVARMKVDNNIFAGRTDPDTMIGESSDCNTKTNICKYKSTIEWTNTLCESSSAAYKTDDDNIFDSTLHLVIMGVELKVALDHQYDTGYYKLTNHDVFTCTGSCDACKTENPCVKKVFKRESDTSWGHNPVDCLSVNSGCTCTQVEVSVDHSQETFSVYKTGQKELSAVICMEYNNIFIDCELIRSVDSYKIGVNTLHVNTWDTDFAVPETIIVKNDGPNNNLLRTAYTGVACKKGSCRMGDFGDIQFGKQYVDCKESLFIDPNDIKGELLYNFGRTPKWNIEYPLCGAHNFKTFTPLTNNNEYSDHYVNISDNTLVVDSGCVGKFALKLELNDMKVHRRIEDAKIESFTVDYCSGEYGSMLGAICTFSVVMRGTPKGTIKLEPSSTLMMQDDGQAIDEGKNVFRKYMFVRGLHPSYQFCYRFMNQRGCTNVNNNFTAPKEVFTSKGSNTIISASTKYVSVCNNNYSFTCIYERLKDLLDGLGRLIYYIIAAVIIYMLIKLAWWVFKTFFTKEYEGVKDRTQNLIHKVRIFKERGFRRKYY